MRILVTGGAGYIGGFTARRLLAKGHTVVVYDNLTAGQRGNVPPANLIVGDLKDIDHLDHQLVVNRIDTVLHFAAQHRRRRIGGEPGQVLPKQLAQ